MNDTPSQPETSSRAVVAAFVLIALATIGAAAVLLFTRPDPVRITINPPQPTATALPTPTPQPVTVYITGAVAQPETVASLPAGSRVQDALDAAGGVTENADLERVNLAETLRDGDQVHVFERGDPNAAILATPNTTGFVRVNSATEEELMTLPGIGEEMARRIIEYRDANGPFASLDDLDNVSGIGPAMIDEIKAFVLFD